MRKLIKARVASADKVEKRYRITPKGIAWYSYVKHLNPDVTLDDDTEEFEDFWEEFADGMKRAGYAHED